MSSPNRNLKKSPALRFHDNKFERRNNMRIVTKKEKAEAEKLNELLKSIDKQQRRAVLQMVQAYADLIKKED